MAAFVLNIPASTAAIVENVLDHGSGQITALCALRKGVVALVDHLERQCAAAPTDVRVEKSFSRACEELKALDDVIMETPASCIDELAAQVAVVEYLADGREYRPEHVKRLLNHVLKLAG